MITKTEYKILDVLPAKFGKITTKPDLKTGYCVDFDFALLWLTIH